jgi:ribosome-associated toxin RatA of RatAB toxin-antitoxin module
MFSMKPVAGGPTGLPITYSDVVEVPAPAAALFGVLSEIGSWDRWFTGMRRVRIDGAASGVGALRTVWVGATSVQERFDVWEENTRLVLTMTKSNLPGLRSMAEEWRIEPNGESASTLTITVGIAPTLALVPLRALVRAGAHGATKGGANIVSLFARG